jgi:hypothetical protein
MQNKNGLDTGYAIAKSAPAGANQLQTDSISSPRYRFAQS